MPRLIPLLALVLLAGSLPLSAQQPDLAAQLRTLDATVVAPAAAKEKQLSGMVEKDIRTRAHAAHQREADAFAKLQTRADWEKFRDTRLTALRAALGPLPPPGQDLKLRVARSVEGDGYRRDDIVFESRPGLFITANLYAPAKPSDKMPGITVIHGFHQPKTQAELQDMGVNWAKLGCIVVVPDVLGHGERKQHPFLDASSYPGKFNVPRQDYYSRANVSVHLHTCGESLMGWMVHDTLRCVDLLLSRPGVDKDRIIVLGAVAAGGDIAGMAAALDPRITCVVPFNFGGPEPETVYPLPASDAEKTFPYAAGGHWDSTRRLRNAARDGFLPWVVVGATAPRRLIYAHEFAWDQPHDPVWPRLQKVYDWHAVDGLAKAHGSGTLFGMPEGTGCANIGAVHRQEIYPTLKKWYNMPAPAKEVQDRKPPPDMQCLTPKIVEELKPRTVQAIAAELGRERWLKAHQRLVNAKEDERRTFLRQDWAKLLGDVEPAGAPRAAAVDKKTIGNVTVERIILEPEPGIVVPLVLLLPERKADAKVPVVVGVAQHGKQELLKQRAEVVAALLQGGTAVCLPDVRGTGETTPQGDRRGPPAGTYKGVLASSNGTMLATENLMLGRTLLGDRLRDLRSVLRYLGSRAELSGKVALWGDSLARVNGTDERIEVPWDAEKVPAQSEPLGGLLALLGALYEDSVVAVHVQGGLPSYLSLLQSPFVHVPHDVIVPGALTAGDLGDIAAGLAPRPVRFAGLVNGHNRIATPAEVGKGLEPAVRRYTVDGVKERLVVDGKDCTAVWLLARVK